jgi:hypothetical protein
VECEHPRLAEFVLPFRGLQVYRQLKGSGLQELVHVYPRWISRGERVGLVLLIFTVLISNPDFSPPREHGNRLCLSSQLRRVLRLIHCLNPAYKRWRSLRLSQRLIPQAASGGEKSGLK